MDGAVDERGDDLDVDACGEELVVEDGLLEVHGGEFLRRERRDDGGEVRVTHVDAQAGEARARHRRGGHAGDNSVAHLDGNDRVVVIEGMDLHLFRARAGADGELICVDEAVGAQVMRKDAAAVAAHLGHGAVRIAVVHEPVRAVAVDRLDLAGVEERARADDTQKAVAANTGAAIAEYGDALGCDGRRGVQIGDDDEVVFGAVALGEVSRGHTAILRQRGARLGRGVPCRVEPRNARVAVKPRALAAHVAAGAGDRALDGLVPGEFTTLGLEDLGVADGTAGR